MDNTNIPKYQFVFKDIKSKIQNGEYKINDILPSESELQEYYGVSRITIRHAMEKLQDINLIKKYPGIGTIVINNKKLITLKRVTSFSDENINESSELIQFEEIPAPANIQVHLKLTSKHEVYKIARIRKVEGKKIGVHVAYVPKKIIKLSKVDFQKKNNSLYKLFQKNDIFLTRGSETIEAIKPSKQIRKLLDLEQNEPILYKERVSYSGNRPVEFVKMYYRGDMYKYQVELKN